MFVKLLDDLLGLAMPRRCGVCSDRLVRNESHICSSCLLEMPLTMYEMQKENPMSDRLNARIQDVVPFGPYSSAIALFYYRGKYKNLTRSLKYRANVPLGRHISGILGEKVSGCSFLEDVDVVMPVPLHWTRRLSRGYNQAEIIADEIVRVLHAEHSPDVVLRTDVLKRIRRTDSQTALSVDGKRKNVSGAFRADVSGFSLPHHVLLVDDVFTSGSTIAECLCSLRQALASRYGKEKAAKVKISVATLSFAGD